MNKLPGKIKQIQSSDHFYLIEVNVKDIIFTAVIAKMTFGSSVVEAGRDVRIIFKENEVSIAKNIQGEFSLRNRFDAIVRQVEIKKILARIVLDFQGMPIVSIITAGSAQMLNLNPGDEVVCMVKSTAMSIMEPED